MKTATCLAMLLLAIAAPKAVAEHMTAANPIAAATRALYVHQYNHCMADKPRMLPAIGDCLRSAHRVQDRKLNTVYQALMHQLDDKPRHAMRTAERAWITYRDANCAFSAHPVYTDANLRRRITCKLRMTARRAQELGSTAQSKSSVFSAIESLYSPAHATCTHGGKQDPQHCINAEYQRQKTALRTVRQTLITHLTPHRTRQLHSARAAWITYRDANCRFYARQDSRPPSTAASRCQLRMTTHRANDLRRFLTHLMAPFRT